MIPFWDLSSSSHPSRVAAGNSMGSFTLISSNVLRLTTGAGSVEFLPLPGDRVKRKKAAISGGLFKKTNYCFGGVVGVVAGFFVTGAGLVTVPPGRVAEGADAGGAGTPLATL